MPALSTDYFTKVGSPGTATTLSAPGHTIGGTSITVVATTNWPTGTGAIFAMDTYTLVNGEEVRDVGTYTEWEGVVASATSITNMVLRLGSDQNYAAGTTSRVYIPVAGSQNDRMVDGLIVSHNQDGTMITSLPLTTPKITTSINDSSGNEIIKTPATASAVNEVTITNAATGNSPIIAASGGDSAVNLNLRGLGLAKTVTIGAGATTIFPYDFVVSGCVWTGDSYGVNLNASMTAGVVVINGNPITVALVTARAFTTNVDTYIDVLDAGNGTGTVVYTTAATNAASAALAANSIRIGIIQAAATITAATKVNQGEQDKVFPIASSIPYAVTDSLGNLICPRDPFRRILGYRQLVATTTETAGSLTDVVGLNFNCIIPAGRKVRLSCHGIFTVSVANNGCVMGVYDATAGAQVTASAGVNGASGDVCAADPSQIKTYAAGTRNFKGQISRGVNAATVTLQASANNPAWIQAELV